MSMKKEAIRSVIASRQFGYFIRLGYVIRGLLYALVGFGAFQLASGITSVEVDTHGEIAWLQQVRHGSILLLFVAIGLAGYAAWGYIRAGIDIVNPDEDVSYVGRVGYLASAVSYSLLALFAFQLALHVGEPIHAGKLNQQVARIMSYPFGGSIVVAVGAGMIVAGFYQMQKAIRADRPIDFLSRQKHPVYSMPFMIFAKTGIVIRALTFVLIGFYIARAGWLLNPDKIHTFKSLLLSIQDEGIGMVALPIIAIGFLCFACYSLLLSWWVDLPEKES